MRFDKNIEMPNSASAMFQEDTWLNTGSLIVGIAVIVLAIVFRGYYVKNADEIGKAATMKLNAKAPVAVEQESATEWYAWVSEIQGETVPEYDEYGEALTGKQVQAMQLNIATTKPDEKDAYMGKISKNDIAKLRFDNSSEETTSETYDSKNDPMKNIKRINCPEKVKMPKNMMGTFTGCFNLENTSDLKNFDTSEVEIMSYMFCSCYNLKTIDVPNWNTSKVKTIESMFAQCRNLTFLNISNWDTSNMTNMQSMFGECKNLKALDVSNWDTSNVTNMLCMFLGCENLKKLDVSKWNISKVTNMVGMFDDCPEEIIPSWYKN